jgi:anti-anti-sigma regulatory factor
VVIEELAGQVRLVRLVGEHDLESVPTVQRTLASSSSLIVDLTETQFIDSTIIGVLIGAGRASASVIVSPPGSAPRRVLDTVRAGDLVPIVDDRATALAMFGIERTEEPA